MSIFNSALRFLLAVALAALTLPSVAQTTKIYGLTATVDGTQVTVAIKNLAPPSQASSNIGSMTINVDTAFAGLQIVDVVDGYPQKFDKNGNQVIGFTATVTPLGAYPNSGIAITGIPQNIKGQEQLVVKFDISGCGTANKFGDTWTAKVYTGTNLTGSQFNLDRTRSQTATDLVCQSLASSCGNPTQQTIPRTDNGSNSITVIRGPYNSDGTCSPTTPTGFFVNNNLNTDLNGNNALDTRVQLTWPLDTPDQNQAAFEFLASAPITTTNPDAPWLSWKNYSDGHPAFISISKNSSSLICSTANSAGDYFPRPYGTLLADVAKNDKTIKVSAGSIAWPTSFETSIIIEDELMFVTKINTSNNTWTVRRPTPANLHVATKPVMYTPLKVLGAAPTGGYCSGTLFGTCPYTAGELAKSCQTPTSANPPGNYEVIGIGDPVWSGGDL